MFQKQISSQNFDAKRMLVNTKALQFEKRISIFEVVIILSKYIRDTIIHSVANYIVPKIFLIYCKISVS